MQNNPTSPLLVVAAALISSDGEILLQRRPEGRSMAGLWEFPGGKLEFGESPEAALARELGEELAIVARPEDFVPACFASAMIETDSANTKRSLILLLYICRTWYGNPQAIESPEIGWFTIAEMRSLPMPPADLPLLDLLEKLL